MPLSRTSHVIRAARAAAIALAVFATAFASARTHAGAGAKQPTPPERSSPPSPSPQVTSAQAAALAGQVCPVLTTGTHNLGRGWRLTIYTCEYDLDSNSLDFRLKARLRKENRSLPDISTTGTIKLRFALKFEVSAVPPRLCLASLQITGMNFRNVQNDVEQIVRRSINELLARVFCISVGGPF